MDTLAALALATEKPSYSIMKHPPVKKNDKIMTSVLWRQIYGMSAYIIVVMTILIVFGKLMWGLDYERTTQFYDENNDPTDRTKHYTLLFNTFIFLHIFNEINCRTIGPNAYNIFRKIYTNWLFLAVIAATVAVQWFFVNVLQRLINCTSLTSKEFATCIMIGMTTWVVAFALKLTPNKWLELIPSTVDENMKESGDPLMKIYSSQAKGKVLGKDSKQAVKPE